VFAQDEVVIDDITVGNNLFGVAYNADNGNLYALIFSSRADL
jgi:hypothetical protein